MYTTAHANEALCVLRKAKDFLMIDGEGRYRNMGASLMLWEGGNEPGD
jgi:hypothetical protein